MSIGSQVTQALFSVALLGLCMAIWRRRLTMAAAACGVYLLYCMVGAQWFNPWYVLWFAPILPLALGGARRVGMVMMVLSPLLYALDPVDVV